MALEKSSLAKNMHCRLTCLTDYQNFSCRRSVLNQNLGHITDRQFLKEGQSIELSNTRKINFVTASLTLAACSSFLNRTVQGLGHY